MFHAVILEPGVEMDKVLAFSSAGLRAGVERREGAGLDLTAIIEPAAKIWATNDEPERLEMYRFGMETMEEHHIRVLTTSDMGRVAETARRELRVLGREALTGTDQRIIIEPGGMIRVQVRREGIQFALLPGYQCGLPLLLELLRVIDRFPQAPLGQAAFVRQLPDGRPMLLIVRDGQGGAAFQFVKPT